MRAPRARAVQVGSAVMERRIRAATAGCAASGSAWSRARTPRPGWAPSTRSSTTSRRRCAARGRQRLRHGPTGRRDERGRRGRPRGAARPRAGGLDDHRAPDRLDGRASRAAHLAGRRGDQGRPVRRRRRRRSSGPTPPAAARRSATRLDELRALAGAAKLSIDVLPVCAEVSDTGKGRGSGALTTKQRDAYAAALEARMAQLSGHV